MRPRKKIKVRGLRADWKHPTEIRFGVGRIGEIADACTSMRIRKPLLVTDRGIARLPFIKDILELNRRAGIDCRLYAELAGEPDLECVQQGAEVFRKGGFEGIIAVGGGGALDAGKAVALATVVGLTGLNKHAFGAGPSESKRRNIPPIIAVPTTAGTGSEVDANAVISNEARQSKLSLYHPQLLPKIVIADPALTRRLTPYITAATGMDALSHNLEALCSPVFHPVLDAVALQGIAYIKEWLPVAFQEGRNLQARVYTMAASIMGAVAFEKGLGAMHALAHPIGAAFKSRHGRTVACLMPYVLKFNRRRISEKMEQVARLLDLPRKDFNSTNPVPLDLPQLEKLLLHALRGRL